MASEFEIEILGLKVFPDASFQVLLSQEPLECGSSFFAVSPVHLEFRSNDYQECLTLHLEQGQSQYDFKIEPLSLSLVLSLNLIPVLEPAVPSPIAPFSCRYLNNISSFESHFENTKNILINLEEMMGENYQKMLDDVVKAPSPSRSPIRKMPTKTGMKTPGKTPAGQSPLKKTFSIISQDQGGVVEIPCDEEIFMDKVSGKDGHSLMLVVAGLLAKKRFLKVNDDESAVIQSIMENNSKASAAMLAAFDETKAQIQAEREEISKKIEEMSQVVSDLKKQLSVVNGENEELRRKKEGFQDLVRENNESVGHLKQLDVSQSENILAEILNVRSQSELVENQRKQLQSDYALFMKQFREDMAEKDREVSRKQDLLNRAIADHNQKDVFLTHLVQDNSKLQASVLETTSKLIVKMSQNDRVQLLSELISKDAEAVHNLSERLEELILKFEEIKKSTESSLAEIHSSKVSLDQKTLQAENRTQERISENESLQVSINVTKENLREMKELYERTSSIEQSFLNTKKRLLFAYENKEHTVREMKYLSDLILHLTSCYTSAHRSFNKANSLLEQKTCEVITIHNALEELKKKYPVYFSVKEDPLDLALGNYLNGRDVGLAVPFIREGGGVYFFGTRKVLVNYERGKLTVKVGGGFLPIEEFIHAYSDIELEKFTNKCQELSPKTKKFLGKWAGGLVDCPENQGKVKDILKQAAEDHKYAISFAVRSPERSPSPVRKARTSII
jgi:hypothetical protein